MLSLPGAYATKLNLENDSLSAKNTYKNRSAATPTALQLPKPCYNIFMSRNFQVRLICSIGLFAVAVIAMYAFGGIPFKVLAVLFVAVAMIELFSFLQQKKTAKNITLLIFELIFLLCGVLFVCNISVVKIWYIIFGVCGYDIFAYLCGHLFGGKIFKKSRPFPKISQNKTWEGTILGLVISTGLVAAIIYLTGGTVQTAWPYLLCGVLALIGDLFESYLKRQFKVKDSNELIVQKPVFSKIEYLVGGKEGHGGFLDRIDSIAFAATVLLFIFLL